MLKLLKLCNSRFLLIRNQRAICIRVSRGRVRSPESSGGAGQLFAAEYIPVGHSKLVQDHFSYCIFLLPILEYSLNKLTVRLAEEEVLFRMVKMRPAARSSRRMSQ